MRAIIGMALIGLMLGSGTVIAGDVTRYTDSFDETSSADNRPNWRKQEQMGKVLQVPGPVQGHSGLLLATAGPKSKKVGKAALIAPFDPMGSGTKILVAADFYFPKATPLNSIILMDLECKHCGEKGNPGLRLYLRDAHVRLDRKKIGKKHAWVGEGDIPLATEVWIHIEWDLALGLNPKEGQTVIRVDGIEVLRKSGRTLPALPRDIAAVDRLQIGITANSNSVPVQLYVDNVTIELHR